MFASCRNRDTPVDKSTILGIDYRLFQGTEAWELAKAVDDGDTIAIKKQVLTNKVNVNYPEPLYGKTLLMLSVMNGQYNSCKALLESGADPNLHDAYNGTSAIIEAAIVGGVFNDGTRFLKLLLAFGANPNDIETGDRPKGNSTRETPLMATSGTSDKLSHSLEKVIVLVAAGANINFKNEFGQTALGESVIQDNLGVSLYLLEKGADYNVPVTHTDGKDYYLWDELRFMLFELNSEKHTQKMDIVAFLQKNNINYRALPIPDYAINEAKKRYPQNWKGYLEKY